MGVTRISSDADLLTLLVLTCRFCPRDFLGILMPFVLGGVESGYEEDCA